MVKSAQIGDRKSKLLVPRNGTFLLKTHVNAFFSLCHFISKYILNSALQKGRNHTKLSKIVS